nr:MAG TPA: hypothetical protein [Caudoviricetes sp.]
MSKWRPTKKRMIFSAMQMPTHAVCAVRMAAGSFLS